MLNREIINYLSKNALNLFNLKIMKWSNKNFTLSTNDYLTIPCDLKLKL